MEFAKLSEQGKWQKLRRHLEVGHPVPASWVEWLIAKIPDDSKVPASWVEWLITKIPDDSKER